MEDCEAHYADVIGVVFRQEGLSLEKGITAQTEKFQQEQGGGSHQWTQEETRKLCLNIIVDKNAAYLGISRGIKVTDIENHFGEFMAWIYRTQPQFSQGDTKLQK